MAERQRGLADLVSIVWRTNEPEHQIGYCPSPALLPDGRLVGTLLVYDARLKPGEQYVVHAYTSDDAGTTWTQRAEFTMVDAFPFLAGSAVYIIGGREDLKVARSDDGGITWGPAIPLETGRRWYSFPGSTVEANGKIYMVRECRTEPDEGGFPVWSLAPVVISASLNDDLTRPSAWSYSNVLSFGEVLETYGKPHLIGVPFYESGQHGVGATTRTMSKIGWGEANLVRINDPDHIWHDPAGKTFHMFLRCTTGRSNLACMAKAAEGNDGSIRVDLQHAPSGEPILYVPFPGGHIGFTMQYDAESGLHWLVASQATDSMRRVERLHPKHYGMPFNERRNLALYFSRNCTDWCFAGLLVNGDETTHSCYHGGFVINGNDLIVMMRTADTNAVNAHNSNMITCHRVERFRDLIY